MIIILVLGRWLMPKGDMSRNQLSQLLLVYVGVGTDILNIFPTFKKTEVKKNRFLIIVGLSLFSWALMQFPLNLIKGNHPKRQKKTHLKCTRSCYIEIWRFFTDGSQDVPFLVYRLYLMSKKNMLDPGMIFFSCKNILIVLLGLYRFGVVFFGRNRPGGGERSAQRQTELVESL